MLARYPSCILFAAIIANFAVRLPASAAVQPLPPIPGVEPSKIYRVYVNEKEVHVGSEKTGGKVVETAPFLFSGRVDVRICVNTPFATSTIRPLRFKLGEQAKIESSVHSEKEIRFSLNEPRKLIVEMDQLPPLVLIGSPLDDDLPSPNDPSVIYFGPGVHEPGRIRLKSNQTVFLAAGAKVYGTIEGSCVENVRVTGRGHLYGTKDTNWHKRTYGIIFDRCRNVTVEKIGVRDCYWWTTEFLLCNGVNIRDINMLTFNRNNGGLMIDGCSNLSARDSLLMTRDDCICPHALNAAGNGEEISDNMLFENLILYNVDDGNGIRIGASFETSEVRNWTFRNIDVVRRNKNAAAILSDHSDWAVVRNLVFENFTDEGTTGYTVNMQVAKTRYSCQTGYRDERGRIDGLYFINVRSLGGKFLLKGFDKEHGINNVVFAGCRIGNYPFHGPEDISASAFVTNVQFAPSGEQVSVPSLEMPRATHVARNTSPKELIIDDGEPGFRSYGFTRKQLPHNAYGDAAQIGQVADAFGIYAAAIYEPQLHGRYDVFVYCGKLPHMDERAPWIIKHRDGYTRAYVNQNENPGWHSIGTFQLDADSNVRVVWPDYFEPTNRPVVADAVKFVRVSGE